MQAAVSPAVPAVEDVNLLGESPLWDWRERCLYWVDVRAPRLWRLAWDSGETTTWPMPELVVSVLLRHSGGLIVGLASGLYAFDRATGTLELLVAREEPYEGNRVNDCKVDRSGFLWWSSMWDFGARTTGSLYRLAPDLTVEVVRRNITIPNGICFDPDGTRGYFADTPTGRIETFELGPDGAIGPFYPFAAEASLPGLPDGSTSDADGCVWNARYGGGAIARLTRGGELDALVPLPVSQPSCCAFAGPDLSTLFITTSRQKLSPEQRQAEPLAGRLLKIATGVQGVPEPEFLG